MKNIIYTIISVLLFSACEEVITIDFGEKDTELVIEAYVKAEKDSSKAKCWVKISTSTDYYKTKPYTYKNNAKVEVSIEKTNKTFNIPNTDKGIYESEIDIELLSNYNLKVELEGKIYTATSFLNNPVDIDSIMFEIDPFDKEKIMARCKLTDDAKYENFYRAKLWHNGKIDKSNYFLNDDDIDNGKTISIYMRPRGRDEDEDDDILKGDTIDVELYSIDKSTYEYYEMLSEVLTTSDDEQDVPANPKSNMSGDILGYFGVFSTTKKQVIAPGLEEVKSSSKKE